MYIYITKYGEGKNRIYNMYVNGSIVLYKILYSYVQVEKMFYSVKTGGNRLLFQRYYQYICNTKFRSLRICAQGEFRRISDDERITITGINNNSNPL